MHGDQLSAAAAHEGEHRRVKVGTSLASTFLVSSSRYGNTRCPLYRVLLWATEVWTFPPLRESGHETTYPSPSAANAASACYSPSTNAAFTYALGGKIFFFLFQPLKCTWRYLNSPQRPEHHAPRGYHAPARSACCLYDNVRRCVAWTLLFSLFSFLFSLFSFFHFFSIFSFQSNYTKKTQLYFFLFSCNGIWIWKNLRLKLKVASGCNCPTENTREKKSKRGRLGVSKHIM
ncbi:hypothetical protein DFH27DRAFT_243314 [Peziza echinospora]|nr:hypothetical protein DFH27DRAFT_243314 [Peziza echinospora]